MSYFIPNVLELLHEKGVREVFGTDIQFDPKLNQILVCVLQNGPEAIDGTVCYNLDELRACINPNETRTKLWFMFPKSLILKTCPNLADILPK